MTFKRRALLILGCCAVWQGASAQDAGSVNIVLVVKNGGLISGPTLVKLKRGEKVALAITSDRGDELHLHGYDLHLKLTANEPVVTTFIALRTGRFKLELHKLGLDLAVLEIYPK